MDVGICKKDIRAQYNSVDKFFFLSVCVISIDLMIELWLFKYELIIPEKDEKIKKKSCWNLFFCGSYC